MSAMPDVRRTGRGEKSRVTVKWGTIRFSMSQEESRALVNALSKVTLMPQRQPKPPKPDYDIYDLVRKGTRPLRGGHADDRR